MLSAIEQMSRAMVVGDYSKRSISSYLREMRYIGECYSHRLVRVLRFCLPRGYCKIRSSGLYANHGRRTRVTALLEQLDVPQHPEPVSMPWYIRWMERGGVNPLICTCCKEGQMVLIQRTLAPAWGKEVLRE